MATKYKSGANSGIRLRFDRPDQVNRCFGGAEMIVGGDLLAHCMRAEIANAQPETVLWIDAMAGLGMMSEATLVVETGWHAFPAPTMDRASLKRQILRWIESNHGKDAEDVAKHFAIPDGDAVDLVGELLDEGRLSYDE